jgi:mannopine transport system substrate-binding protein
MMIKTAIRLSGIAMLCTAAFLGGQMPRSALAGDQVVIATTGGAYDAALRKWWFDPFTAKTGIQVVSVAATNAEMRAKATAMVKTGNVTWDLYPGQFAGSSRHF